MSETQASNGKGPRVPSNHIELYRRPLRRAVKGPSSEATGSDGKAAKLRQRGKGQPPQSEEYEFQPSKHFVPGKSFASSVSHVLQQQGCADESASGDSSAHRPLVRPSTRTYETHLSGSGAAVTCQEEVVKPKRRPATAGPRTERVLGMDPDGGADGGQPTYALLGSARRDVFITSRRQAAPACVLLTKTQTRVGYDMGRSAYEDVLQYRHSGGICPRDYKLVAERPSAPQLVVPVTQQARNSFFDSRNSYNANKMRAQMSDIIIGQ